MQGWRTCSGISRLVAPTLAAALLVTAYAGAGAQSFGGEALSPRVVADYVFAPPAPGVVAADPGVAHPLVAVLLWRGQPGWQADSARVKRPPGPAAAFSMSVGGSFAAEHLENVGGHDLSFRYDRRRQTIEVLGRPYDVSRPVAILIDRADGAGGPAHVVGVVRLSNPFVLPARWSDAPGGRRTARGVLLAQSLRQYPEIENFMR